MSRQAFDFAMMGLMFGSAGLLLGPGEAVGQFDRLPAVQRDQVNLPAVQKVDEREAEKKDQVLVIILENTIVESYQKSAEGEDRPQEQMDVASPKLMVIGAESMTATLDGTHALRDGTSVTIRDGKIADAAGPSAPFIQAIQGVIDPAGLKEQARSMSRSLLDSQPSLTDARLAVDGFLKSAAEEEEEDVQAMTAGREALKIDGIKGESAEPSVMVVLRGMGGEINVLACANGEHLDGNLAMDLPGDNKVNVHDRQLEVTGPLAEQFRAAAIEEEEVQNTPIPQLRR